MKQTLLLIVFVLGSSYAAFASACGSTGDKLSDYIALGTCTLTGTDLTFSDFGYSVSGGGIPIPATEVTVVPDVISATDGGFIFNAPWVGLVGDDTLDADITYTATCGGCEIDDWYLSMGGNSLGSSDGFIDIGETSNQVPGADWLSVGQNPIGTISSATTTFPPVTTLSVDKDLRVFGGTTGTGTPITTGLSSVTNLFSTTAMSTVPEPAMAILCAGFLGLLPLARRKFVR